MLHEKRYLQFNNLVFDGYDMISSSDESTSFKVSSQSYSFGDGSYVPLKDENMFTEEGSVTLTLVLYMKKIPCEYREYYGRFAEQELVRPGKLWALKNNEVIWAYAYVKNIHQVKSRQLHRLEYDIEFGLPEGKWHKADKQKTFLLPYNVCTFMECKGYKTIQPCSGSPTGDCCEVCEQNRFEEDMDDRCFCCCVDEITADMALCYHLGDLQKFTTCETPYQIVYDCNHADKFNHNDYLGQKLCVKDKCDDSVIAGRFYSETDLITRDVGIVISGKMHNPWITINGNTNIINGDYDGDLIIEPSGDIYYKQGECCQPELLSSLMEDETPRWIIPSGNTYGWKVYPQNNSIVVNLNQCCAGMTCVYIQQDPVTI